jgi:hypothetical protein
LRLNVLRVHRPKWPFTLASPSDYGTTPLRRESGPIQRLLNTCVDGKSPHDGFLHTFTVLPNNVTSGLYGA